MTSNIRSALARHRRIIFLAWGAFLLENLLRLAQPAILGIAIDGLLSGSWHGLAWLIFQCLAHTLVSCSRQMMDARIFTTVYTSLVTEIAIDQHGCSVNLSRIAARTSLSRQFVDFVEKTFPLALQTLFSLIGSLVVLIRYDRMLAPMCLLLLLPMTLFNIFYGRRAAGLNYGLHNQLEREVDALTSGTACSIRNHFRRVAKWRIRLADAQAFNFGAGEFFVLALLAAALIHFCGGKQVRAGDVAAVFRYLMLFLTGIDSVPEIVSQLVGLRDVYRRITSRSHAEAILPDESVSRRSKGRLRLDPS